MAKFRTKPVEVDAFQIDYEWGVGVKSVPLHWPGWFKAATRKLPGEPGSVYLHANGFYVVFTLKGLMEIHSGDYVICGIKGELCPCKPDIFEATYEKV